MAPSRLDSLVGVVTDKVTTEKDPDMPYVGLEHIATGSPDLLGTAPSSSSISTNSVFATGDTLYGKLRPNLRKAVIAPFAGYCSTDLLVLRALEGVDPSYVGRLFQSEDVVAAAMRTATGTKMPRTSWTALRGLRVHSPAQADQRRIAEILDTLDEAIRKTEQLIAKLKQVEQGVLHDLFTRGIDDSGALRDPAGHPEGFGDSPLGIVPRCWRVKSLGELAVRLTDGSHQSLPRSTGPDATVPFLFVSCIRNGEIQWERGARITQRVYAEVSRGREPHPGMVLYTIVGSFGHAACVDEERAFAFERNIACISVSAEVNPSFLVHQLNHARLRRIADASAVGNAQRLLTLGVLRNLPIAVPPPGEQARITEVLHSAHCQLKLEFATAQALRLLKQGLMEDLLTGRVPVASLLDETAA